VESSLGQERQVVLFYSQKLTRRGGQKDGEMLKGLNAGV